MNIYSLKDPCLSSYCLNLRAALIAGTTQGGFAKMPGHDDDAYF